MNDSRPSPRLDAEGDIGLQLAVEPLAKVAGGEEIAFTDQGRVIDGEEHAQGRLVDLDPGQGDRVGGISQRVADVDQRGPHHSDDIASFRLVHIDPTELVENQHAISGTSFDHAVGLEQGEFLPLLDPTRGDPPDADPADVFGEVERGAEHLERAVGVDLGTGDLLDDQVEERLDVARPRRRVVRREAAPARGENVREVELFFAGAEFDEAVEDLVEDLVGPSVGAVNLVDHDDRPDAVGERLAQNELGLRHRPFERVDQHKRTVGHLQGSFDLAAEIGVPRRVDDVDLRRAVVDRDVLRQDCDPPLPLLRVRVEDAILGELNSPELAGLAQHDVDQSGLAMVNVGNNRHVADVIASGHEEEVRQKGGAGQGGVVSCGVGPAELVW